MNGRKYEFLIVGSGAGGGALARELSRREREVLVVERGSYEQDLGTVKDALRFFDTSRLFKTPSKSKEGVLLWRTIMAGGSTAVSSGNATRCLEEELAGFGIMLEEEFEEAEKDMNAAPITEDFLSEGSKRIKRAAGALGYRMEMMPKSIDPKKCRKCGKCVFGCGYGAKWTSRDYLDEAGRNGAGFLYNTGISEIIIENGRVRGVRGQGPQGPIDISADTVILAAGGLGTPVILQQSGIREAGQGLFVDLFVNTYGVTGELSQFYEPTMALVDREFHEKGFILSSFIEHHKLTNFIEIGLRGLTLPMHRLMGIMTKTSDEPSGRVHPDGTVSKPVTEADWKRLRNGSAIAKEILVEAGAESKSVVISKPQGAHPGGTAAVGRVVDKDLQAGIDNLFVCDASVLPAAPGMPPILTIVALAKRLAKTLAP